MFRLDQQIERRKATFHCVVGENDSFGRSRRQAGIDDAAEQALGCDHPWAAGANDLERRFHRFRAIGDGSNGLRTANLVDGFHTGKACCNERGSIDGTIRRRRGDDGKIRHASNHSRNGGHHGDGRKRPLPRGI